MHYLVKLGDSSLLFLYVGILVAFRLLFEGFVSLSVTRSGADIMPLSVFLEILRLASAPDCCTGVVNGEKPTNRYCCHIDGARGSLDVGSREVLARPGSCVVFAAKFQRYCKLNE